MEQKKHSLRGLNTQRSLQIFVYVCAILVLIILAGAFQKTDGGALSGEIYIRPYIVESSGE